MSKQKVGTLIKDIRNDLQLSEEILAEKLNVSVDKIKAWEEGTKQPTDSQLKALSKVFSETKQPKPPTFMEYLKNHWMKIGYYFLYIGVIGIAVLIWTYFKNQITGLPEAILVFGGMFILFIIGGFLLIKHYKKKQIKSK